MQRQLSEGRITGESLAAAYGLPQGSRVVSTESTPEGLKINYIPPPQPGQQQIQPKLGELQFSSEGGYAKVGPTALPTRMQIRPYGTEEDFPETKRRAQAMIPEGKGVEVSDINLANWWATVPSVGEVTGEMQRDVASGKAYAWNAEDVYNIVSTSLLIGSLAYKGIQLARGAKATVLRGAAEIERSQAGDDFLESMRKTYLRTEDVRVPRSEAKWLQEVQRYVTPTKVEFGGQEKLLLRGGDDIIFQQRYTSALRGAAPYVSALKAKDPFVYSYTYISEPQVWSGVSKYSLRHFTTAQFFGKIDPQVYLRYIKTVPVEVAAKWYPQMGGVAIQQLERLSFPSGIGVVTKLVSVSIPKLGTSIILPPIIKPFSTQSPKIPMSYPSMESTIRPFSKIEPVSLPHFKEETFTPSTPAFDISPVSISALRTKPEQGQKLIPSFPSPTIPRARRIWPFQVPIRRGGEAGGGGKRSMFGQWWYKKHPFPTPMEMLFGKKARAKRRKHKK